MKGKKQKKYSREKIREVLKAGGSWRMTIELDNDVATNVLEEKDNAPKSTSEYAIIINNRLRESYKSEKQNKK
jgi:hypothetical protein